MKRSMKLIDRFHTPEDWKTRAAKIAKGKGIYAGVKTGSRFKAAIAAALALALGLEGYSLLSGTEGERTLIPVPTESTQDEATRRYVLRQRLKSYYPIASEKGLDDTLILVDKSAYIVSVKNNTVITTVSNEELVGNCFTNIEGTVIV